MSTWVQTTFSTMACVPQAGQPVDLRQCLNDNGDVLKETNVPVNNYGYLTYSFQTCKYYD